MTNGTGRLDRIERLVEANSVAIAENSGAISELRDSQQSSGDRVDARLNRLAAAIMDERVQRAEDRQRAERRDLGHQSKR